MLTSLLIKFVCRTLPNESPENQSRYLFEVLKEKNINLPKKILDELDNIKISLGALLNNAIDITLYFATKKIQKMRARRRLNQEEINNNENENENEEPENQEDENEEDNDNNQEDEEEKNWII